MSNPNFDPTLSTHSIWVGDEESLCLTDHLEEIVSDISALQTGKADTGHTHTGYATADHTHTGYATADHTHTGYAPSSHTHAQGDISGLSIALSGKADADHTHSSYASASHTHDEYAPSTHSHSGYAASSHGHAQSDITGLTEALSGKADACHTHTGYASADHTHSGYAAENHTHSGYAAENHTHTGYAASEHTHGTSDISGLDDALAQAGGVPVVAITSTDGVNYTGTVPGMTALTIGKPFIVVPDTTSTATGIKLNVNSLGAKNLRQSLSTATSATVEAANVNWLSKNKPVMVMWDGLFFKADITRPSVTGLYGTMDISKGGTGATTAAEALTNLGAASAADLAALAARVSALENS